MPYIFLRLVTERVKYVRVGAGLLVWAGSFYMFLCWYSLSIRAVIKYLHIIVYKHHHIVYSIDIAVN